MHQALSGVSGATAVWAAGSGPLAATQAAWRFLNNDRVALDALAEPLRAAGRTGLSGSAAAVGLLVHDWSMLSFGGHASKSDRLRRTHEHDVGYELSAALLVDASAGVPLAPMLMHLRSASTLHSTEPAPPSESTPHVDQVAATMQASRRWGLSKPLVHVIDREGDSLGHWRQWDQAGELFLTRSDDRCVLWEGREQKLSEVVRSLSKRDAFGEACAVDYRGKPALQSVAQTTVTLHRPAKTRIDGRQTSVPGEPMELRLIVSRVCDERGRVLATWLLLSNVPATLADAATLALWYYWRWRIESFFKLLKSHGQAVEQWLQRSADALARRLLIAAMACVCVWQLQSREDPPAQRMKQLLVRLSGRQTKRKRPHTAPALLAGLFVLLPMLALLEAHDGDLSALTSLAQQTLPFLHSG